MNWAWKVFEFDVKEDVRTQMKTYFYSQPNLNSDMQQALFIEMMLNPGNKSLACRVVFSHVSSHTWHRRDEFQGA